MVPFKETIVVIQFSSSPPVRLEILVDGIEEPSFSSVHPAPSRPEVQVRLQDKGQRGPSRAASLLALRAAPIVVGMPDERKEHRPRSNCVVDVLDVGPSLVLLPLLRQLEQQQHARVLRIRPAARLQVEHGETRLPTSSLSPCTIRRQGGVVRTKATQAALFRQSRSKRPSVISLRHNLPVPVKVPHRTRLQSMEVRRS